MNLHKHVWTEGLQMDDFRVEGGRNNERLKKLVGLADGYEKRVKEETELTKGNMTLAGIEEQQQLLAYFQLDKEASAPKEKSDANGHANGDAMDVEEEL